MPKNHVSGGAVSGGAIAKKRKWERGDGVNWEARRRASKMKWPVSDRMATLEHKNTVALTFLVIDLYSSTTSTVRLYIASGAWRHAGCLIGWLPPSTKTRWP
jgi:hypothetical protein